MLNDSTSVINVPEQIVHTHFILPFFIIACMTTNNSSSNPHVVI